MFRLYHFLLKSLALISICLFIFACSRYTQENFEKIKLNMNMKEVISILGEPTSTDSVNIAGISGTAAIWKDKNTEITIQFINDHVVVKLINKENNVSK